MANSLSSEIKNTPVSSSSELVITDIRQLSVSCCNIVCQAVMNGRHVILKAARTDNGSREINSHLLRREYELLNRIECPFIVNVRALVTLPSNLFSEGNPADGSTTVLVLDYTDGRDLETFLSEKPGSAARHQLLNELLEAIEYLHKKQITHADLKPQNILVTHNGNHVKLIDLGLADDDAWLANNIGFTQQYAAPEQFDKDGTTDCRTDIYALGHIIRLLFPHRYRRAVRRCLQHNPDRRWQSVAELRKALRRSYLPWLVLLLIAFAALMMFFLLRSLQPSPTPDATPGMADTVVVGNTDVTGDSVSIPASDSLQQHTTPVSKPAKRVQSVAEPVSQPAYIQQEYTPATFNAQEIQQKALIQHEHFRDACLDSISRMPKQYKEYANQYFLAYRDSSNACMRREILRFPEHDMAIARIYDAADRYIFSPPVLSAMRNLPSEEDDIEPPEVKTPSPLIIYAE